MIKAKLKEELNLKKSPNKILLRVNEDSTTYKIFDSDEAAGTIKVTANIKGIEQYDLDQEKETGQRVINKIRDRILGMNIKDAEAYIQNLPEVNSVQIDSWPAWSPTVPKIQENIDFKIRNSLL